MRIAVVVSGQLRTFARCYYALRCLRHHHAVDVYAVINVDGATQRETTRALALLRPRAHHLVHSASLARHARFWRLPPTSHADQNVSSRAARARLGLRQTNDGFVCARVHAAKASGETAPLKRVRTARALVQRVAAQYAQVHEAYAMVRRAIAAGACYDAVLRWRPDTVFDAAALSPPAVNEVYVKSAYIARERAYIGVNDFIWFHHINVIDQIAQFYNALPRLIAAAPFPWRSHIEHWLATFLLKNVSCTVKMFSRELQFAIVR